jgi:hypothetical protein
VLENQESWDDDNLLFRVSGDVKDFCLNVVRTPECPVGLAHVVSGAGRRNRTKHALVLDVSMEWAMKVQQVILRAVANGVGTSILPSYGSTTSLDHTDAFGGNSVEVVWSWCVD